MAGRESDVTKAAAIEGYTEEEYSAYVHNLCGSLAALSTGTQGYEYKRKLLQLAVDLEISSADALRALNTLTITAGAKDNDLTVARKSAQLFNQRSLFKARKMVLFARVAAVDGFQSASNVS